MKYYCLLLSMIILACGQKDDTRTAARQAAEAQTVSNNETELVQRPTTPDTPDPALGTLHLQAPQGKLTAGQTDCFAVTAEGFSNLLSMQYTLEWDPATLKFSEVKGFNLPGLSAQNFGQNRLDKGLLPVVWIDNSLQGVSREDGTALYELCFQAIGTAGQSSTIAFVKDPTPFEVVNTDTKVIPLDGKSGEIDIQ